jgi:hypothetical protein
MTKKYKKELLEILKLEGKRLLTNQILENQITFEEMIRSADYYATLLDMWLLAERFHVPVVFISSKKLLENDSLNLIIQAPTAVQAPEAENNTNYFFIKVPAIGTTSVENIPSYSLIFINASTSKIPLSILDNANDKLKNKKEDEEEEAEEEEEEKEEKNLINNIPMKLDDYLQKLYKKNHPILKRLIPKTKQAKKTLVVEEE